MNTPVQFKDLLESVPNNPRRTITLMTDFGTQDGFVGVMKGVMLQIAPAANIVDITHNLPPFSIEAAGFLLNWSFGYFPAGTVHLCVVDPGVGTRRRVALLECAGHYFVAPDNGVLSQVIHSNTQRRLFSVTNRRYWLDAISNTFHGRDIFSPVAAHLASGVAPEAFGEPVDDPTLLPLMRPKMDDDRIECHVEYIDRFGNMVTDLEKYVFEEWLEKRGGKPEQVAVQLHNNSISGLSSSYGEKEKGDLLAVFDGYNRLEIAISKGNAAQVTGHSTGDTLLITLP